MALRSLFHQNTTYAASDLRALIDALGPQTVSADGVVAKGLTVTNASSKLVVAEGVGLATASASTTGNNYAVINTADVDATNYAGGGTTWAPAGTPTARTDIVFIAVEDKALDLVTSDVTTAYFAYNTTSLPSGKTCIKLAEVVSANGVITTITDVRTPTRRWEDPWGVVGRGVRTGDFGPYAGTTATDVLAASATIADDRLYRISLNCRLYTASGVRVVITMTSSDGTTTYLRLVDTEFYDGTGNTYTLIGQSAVMTSDDLGGAGTRTYKLRAGCADVGQTLYIDAAAVAAGIPATALIIEDIGPDTTVPFV